VHRNGLVLLLQLGRLQKAISLLFGSLLPPGRGAKYCDERVCTVVLSYVSQRSCTDFTRMSIHVTCVRVTGFSSDDSAIRYVLLVFWMTSCFHIMGHIER